MPDWLSIHEPVLVNTIGHCAGTVIFGMLLYLLLMNGRRAKQDRSVLAMAAAALAMLWNLGSLIALAVGPHRGPAADALVAFSFSVLSVLPAVLLHISLESQRRGLWICGYLVSGAAVTLHIADWLTGAPGLHYAALLVVTIGFSALTVLSVFFEWRHANRAAGSRLAGAMALFLLAISFAHYGVSHAHQMAWSREAALHHAGLPLALFVLLQDFRFLLLDAFLRFIINATLAAAAILVSIRILQTPGITAELGNPFIAGVLFVGAGLLLTAFVWVHQRLQALLTRAIFLRANVAEVARELQHQHPTSADEAEYLRRAAETIARFMHASQFELTARNPGGDRALSGPMTVLDSLFGVPTWVCAVAPVRFARGDAVYLMLGARDGGRRYLSEDLQVLAQLSNTVSDVVERLRSSQMQSLVSQAELRALQAQINPHFLFNSLNTLYGTIDRNNAAARRLVLNLADVYRQLLRSEREMVEVEEELRLVRAYLEIEEVRLGTKLRSSVEADGEALHASIPPLSIQPLVENAVRHGVAPRAGDGFVRLTVHLAGQLVAVEVTNSGDCDPHALESPSAGIGLANVRRRLALCYGENAQFQFRTGGGTTTVSFGLPAHIAPAAAAV